jgi:hypothetical protein
MVQVKLYLLVDTPSCFCERVRTLLKAKELCLFRAPKSEGKSAQVAESMNVTLYRENAGGVRCRLRRWDGGGQRESVYEREVRASPGVREHELL